MKIFRSKRKLINRNESQVSWLQIIGFLLILAGILYLVFNMFFLGISSEEVAIIFFDIMMGVAFAFPDMLKDDNRQVSTMRIVVFMFVNVLCMLLLKIGWDKSSFEEIGINGYWMGIIGFLFGAKAAQSFFESWARRKATPDTDTPGSGSEKDVSASTGNPGDAQQAINANREQLLKAHPNIKKLIATYLPDGTRRVPCVDICIDDDAKQNIPSSLEYQDVDRNNIRIKTRVITNYGNAKPHVGRGNIIANDNSRTFPGTACCILEGGEEGMRYLLTCNHVMTGGKFENPGSTGDMVVKLFFGDEFDEIGTWEFGKMDETVDAAIINIERTERIEANDLNPDIYQVSEEDCNNTEVEFKGAFSKTKRAFIIHINQPIDIDYKNKTVEMNNLITLSADLDHFNFTPPSKKGDSGALVYHAESRQPIGMVVGANSQFSFIIPFQVIVDAFPDLDLKILNT